MDVKYNIITIQFESQDLMWQQDGMLNALEETPDKIQEIRKIIAKIWHFANIELFP